MVLFRGLSIFLSQFLPCPVVGFRAGSEIEGTIFFRSQLSDHFTCLPIGRLSNRKLSDFMRQSDFWQSHNWRSHF